MGAIEPRPIEVLTEADAAAGFALSAEAGWNQTLADWLLFLRRGTVYGMRDPDGPIVATAAILPYASVAWISLVLVTPAERRRGLARALVARCLAQADLEGWQTRLDATSDGAAVYAPLGYEPVEKLVRLRRAASPPRLRREAERRGTRRPDEGRDANLEAAQALQPGGRSRGLFDLSPLSRGEERHPAATLLTLDREAFELDRSALIHDLAERPDSILWGDATACCMVRGGRTARHIGLVYGRDPETLADLLGRVAAAEPGELVIDAYAGRERTHAALEALGFVAERSFLRMARGGEPPGPMPEIAFAGAGPEYG